MTIRLENGKEFTARVITQTLRNPDAIMLVIEDDRPLSQVAADFEGVSVIEKIAEGRRSSASDTLTGYTRLTSISRPEPGVVRMVLEGVIE